MVAMIGFFYALPILLALRASAQDYSPSRGQNETYADSTGVTLGTSQFQSRATPSGWIAEHITTDAAYTSHEIHTTSGSRSGMPRFSSEKKGEPNQASVANTVWNSPTYVWSTFAYLTLLAIGARQTISRMEPCLKGIIPGTELYVCSHTQLQ
jgi:hypothetical protein